MNPQTTIAIAIAAVAVIACAVCLALVFRLRSEARNMLAVLVQMEAQTADLSRDLDVATQRSTDLARRVAWLESRQRPAAETVVEQIAHVGEGLQAQNRLNMTERRHRILTLARRGLDAQAVSSTLGLPYGEVELIIGLSRAA